MTRQYRARLVARACLVTHGARLRAAALTYADAPFPTSETNAFAALASAARSYARALARLGDLGAARS